MTTKTKASFSALDLAETLETDTEIADFLALLFAEGSPNEIAAGLGHVARAKGMSQIAKEAGVSRESLYRTLSGRGNPEFGTMINVIRALGMKLVPEPTSI